MKERTKTIIEAGIIILVFVLVSYFVQANLKFFEDLIGRSYSGMVIYVFLTIIAVVFAPISTMPLLPIASILWGWITAAILSTIGWTIGSMIAFLLARKYGVNIIRKFVSLEKIQKYEKSMPEENLFIGIIVLRNLVPADILSYALGIFSKVKTRTYFWATLIGILPGAFIFSYLGGLPFKYQLISGVILLFFVILGLIYFRKFIKKE